MPGLVTNRVLKSAQGTGKFNVCITKDFKQAAT